MRKMIDKVSYMLGESEFYFGVLVVMYLFVALVLPRLVTHEKERHIAEYLSNNPVIYCNGIEVEADAINVIDYNYKYDAENNVLTLATKGSKF